MRRLRLSGPGTALPSPAPRRTGPILRGACAAALVVLLGAALPAGAASAQAPAAPVEITLRVQTPAYQMDAAGVRVPGYGTNDAAGAPALPVWSTVVELPATGRWTVTVTAGETRVLRRERPIPAVPVPQPVSPGPAGWTGADLPGAVPTLDRPDPAIYRFNGFYPASIVRTGAVQWQRGRRLLPVQVFPFEYNPVAGVLHFHPDIRVTVRVHPGGQAAAPAAGRDIAPAANPPASAQGAAGALRLYTGGRGLYRLTGDDLAQAGVPIATTSPATFAVTYLGQPVDIRRVDHDHDGVFDADDLVVFYAEPYTGRYQTQNVYWFTYGGTGSPAMGTRTVSPTGSEPIVTEITRTLHTENNVDYRSLYDRPRDADHWFDSILYPVGASAIVTRTYNLALNRPLTAAPRQVVLKAAVHGGAAQGANPDQSMQMRLNDHDAGLYQWQGSTDITATATVSAAWLDAAPNANTISLVAATAQLPALGYYWISPDWVELSYPAQADAGGTDRVAIEAIRPGANQVQVTGFLTSTVGVYDVRDPRHPVALLTTQAQPAGDAYTLSFWDADLPGPAYALSSEAALLAPARIVADAPSSWGTADHTASYIAIVYHDPGGANDLWDAVDRLLAHRASAAGGGFAVAKVDVQDIYDEFSYGRRDPEAIRSFLTYAYTHWNGSAARPAYVLLAGDGNYDFTGASGAGIPNLIPPYLINIDPWIGETASDNRFVCADGPDDILPDMAIGRIPAQTAADVAAATDKIIAYETTAPAGDWQRRAVYVADNCQDGAGDFHALSDQSRLGWLPASYDDRTIYYGDKIACPDSAYDTVAGMYAGISAAFNDAALMLQWFGHASKFRWGSVGDFSAPPYIFMFDNRDVSSLAANTVWPVTFAYSCWSGYFINLNRTWYYNNMDQTVGEALLLTPGRGSVADVSPSGLHVGGALLTLNQGMTRAIFQERTPRIGDAVDAGKRYYYGQTSSYLDVLDTSILFGDPALRLRLPPEPPTVAAGLNGPHTALTIRWPSDAGYTAYRVWRSTQPYFSPDDADAATPVGTVDPPFAAEIVFADDTPEGIAAIGNPDLNHFYVVRGAGATADSNRVGEFDFTLTR